MADADTMELLADIRHEPRETNIRLDRLTERLDLVDITLLDLAVDYGFLLRHQRAIDERDARLEARVRALEDRVDRLETAQRAE